MARSAKISPSKLLIPLSFGSLLGGATTLIGTPPNIIVSDLLREEGLRPFTFFSYTPLGLVLVASGIIFMLLFGRRLLPDRQSGIEGTEIEHWEELADSYRMPGDIYRLRVRRASKLVGLTIAESRLREDHHLSVLEILRREKPRPAMPFVSLRGSGNGDLDSREPIVPDGDTQIQIDDLLVVQGEAVGVGKLAAAFSLGVQPAKTGEEEWLINEESGVAEVLVRSRSGILGKTLVDARFYSVHGLTVMAIHRPGSPGPLPLKETRLQFGDLLLVQGPWKKIQALKAKRRDFVIIGEPEALLGPPNRRKAVVALGLLGGMLALMITGAIPVVTASMLAALAMVLTGCLSMDEAYQAVDWKSILLFAGMLPMSIALEKVQLVDLVATTLTEQLGSLGPTAIMAAVFLLTSAFTQVISNTATTVLIAPIALAAARSLGVEPHAFVMAVAIAASMAFASPVASPVNTLVLGAGSYRFGDFFKVGLPMILITMVASVLVLPLLWPF